MTDAIRLEGVRLFLGEADGAPVLFEPPDLRVARGEQVAVTGPSGCGKSTLLNLLAGLRRATAGRVVVAGHDLQALPQPALDAFRGRHVGYVFQELNLLAPFSALENALMGARFGARDAAARRAAITETRRLLDRVGLGRRLHVRPERLSVGERQRVAIVRALAKRPEIVLADEPTGALDPSTAAGVFDLLAELAREEECTLLLVTHDHDLAARLPRRLDAAGWVRHDVRGATRGTAAGSREGGR